MEGKVSEMLHPDRNKEGKESDYKDQELLDATKQPNLRIYMIEESKDK